jgi:hypothetical protein
MASQLEHVSEQTLLSYFDAKTLSNRKKAMFLKHLYSEKITFVNKLGFNILLDEYLEQQNFSKEVKPVAQIRDVGSSKIQKVLRLSDSTNQK